MEEYFSLRIEKSKLRNQTHSIFDKIWQNNFMTRDEAYRWLATSLEIGLVDCHISRMKRGLLVKTIELSIIYLNDRYQLTDLPKYKII